MAAMYNMINDCCSALLRIYNTFNVFATFVAEYFAKKFESKKMQEDLYNIYISIFIQIHLFIIMCWFLSPEVNRQETWYTLERSPVHHKVKETSRTNNHEHTLEEFREIN